MVRGWDLITPVGAPLEVVVESAENRQRMFYLMIDQDAYGPSRCTEIIEKLQNNFLPVAVA
jgi:hypothetical protein